MNLKKYCIIGMDKRSVCLRKLYVEQGEKLTDYKEADYILAPIPLTRDNEVIAGENMKCEELINQMKGTNQILVTGSLNKEIKRKLEENKITYIDVMKEESLAIANAIPTAEGAIEVAMEMTDFTLHHSNVLILGYGRIGKVLSKMLHGIGANVFCEARKEKDIALIEAMGYNSVKLENLDEELSKMNVIFNTIPELILDKEKLAKMNPHTCVIDLASNPGGVDFVVAKELGINVIWALSLPSKVAPYTAAMYLKDTIERLLPKE